MGTLVKEGFKVSFEKEKCLIQGRNGTCAVAVLRNGLFILNSVNANSVFENKPPYKNCIRLLPRCLGHTNFKAFKKTVELSEGIQLKL